MLTAAVRLPMESVIPFQELARFKALIRRVDPHAFVVITDTLEVMGQKVDNQPHW